MNFVHMLHFFGKTQIQILQEHQEILRIKKKKLEHQERPEKMLIF